MNFETNRRIQISDTEVHKMKNNSLTLEVLLGHTYTCKTVRENIVEFHLDDYDVSQTMATTRHIFGCRFSAWHTKSKRLITFRQDKCIVNQYYLNTR